MHTVTIATKLDVHGFAMVQIFVMGNLKLKVVKLNEHIIVLSEVILLHQYFSQANVSTN